MADEYTVEDWQREQVGSFGNVWWTFPLIPFLLIYLVFLIFFTRGRV